MNYKSRLKWGGLCMLIQKRNDVRASPKSYDLLAQVSFVLESALLAKRLIQ